MSTSAETSSACREKHLRTARNQSTRRGTGRAAGGRWSGRVAFSAIKPDATRRTRRSGRPRSVARRDFCPGVRARLVRLLRQPVRRLGHRGKLRHDLVERDASRERGLLARGGACHRTGQDDHARCLEFHRLAPSIWRRARAVCPETFGSASGRIAHGSNPFRGASWSVRPNLYDVALALSCLAIRRECVEKPTCPMNTRSLDPCRVAWIA